MLDEKIIQDLIRLIELNMITIEDVKDLSYKTEIQNRLTQ